MAQDDSDDQAAIVARAKKAAGLSGSPAGAVIIGEERPKEDRAVDWDKWALMPTVTIEQGVALSMGLEPSKLRFPSTEERDEYDRRLAVALGNLGHRLKSTAYSGASSHVDRRQFVEWFLREVRWPTPPEFAELQPEKVGMSSRAGNPKHQSELEGWARGIANQRGYGPGLDEVQREFAKPRQLGREWAREAIKKLPAELRQARGNPGTKAR